MVLYNCMIHTIIIRYIELKRILRIYIYYFYLFVCQIIVIICFHIIKNDIISANRYFIIFKQEVWFLNKIKKYNMQLFALQKPHKIITGFYCIYTRCLVPCTSFIIFKHWCVQHLIFVHSFK